MFWHYDPGTFYLNCGGCKQQGLSVSNASEVLLAALIYDFMKFLILLPLLAFISGAYGGTLPEKLSATLGDAKVSTNGDDLIVTTGRVIRIWHWTGKGLATTSLRDEGAKRDYHSPRGTVRCDWDLPGVLGDGSEGRLIDMAVHESDDDGFTGKHLEIVSTIRYEAAMLEVQHVIWVFPGAPGLRTQLRVKALPGFDPKAARVPDRMISDSGGTKLGPGARVDHLPLDLSIPNRRRYWGIFNDPGNRLDQSKPMLEEKVITGYPVFQPETIDWANGIAIEYGEQGVIQVKESAKTVNQPAYLTGAFFVTPNGLDNTGWGLGATEVTADRYRDCWASWTIVYTGGNDGMQLALKQFDAARYPVFPERDMVILSNTWGPANPGGAQFTEEGFVLKEIAAAGDLGIDVMQIDDGWQKSGGGPGASGFLPKYKNGWTDIKAAADRAKVRLGLWVAIRNANPADLKKDLDDLGYVSWKADFEHLANRGDYEARIAKYREVMKHAWMKTQFSLCPEYGDPRYGWYFAREYGSIYFQNIQEGQPVHLTFVPYQVLRQHWLMAKYFPTNKLQVMLQNPKRTRKDVSDAFQHSHGYCFAMGLPFVPTFFQSAQLLDAEGRKELKELIALYKGRREDMFTGLTFPIGDEPNNGNWAGFQMVSTKKKGSGHLLLFRELQNPEAKHIVPLKFLAGKTIIMTDARSSVKRTVQVGAQGEVEFEIAQPADYRLYDYEVK